MNQTDYDKVADGLLALARQIEVSKRPGYVRGNDDVLANFKRAGEQAAITTEQAWAVHFLKHIDAILSMMTQPQLPVSEAADGRFADAVNYLRLGYALLREREPVQQTPAFISHEQESRYVLVNDPEGRPVSIARREVEKPRVDSIFTGAMLDESDYDEAPLAVGPAGYMPARKMSR